MYKRHIVLMTIIFIAISIFSFWSKFQINGESVNNLITFFSIVFGFYLTTFSLLYGSKICTRFSNEEDPLIKTQTKLHTLKKYFQASFIISISSTTTLVIISLLNWTSESKDVTKLFFYIYGFSLRISDFIISLCLGLSAVNIVLICIILKIFLNSFVEES